MPAPAPVPAPQPWHLDDQEMVALAYHREAGGDAWAALVAMARDALADHVVLEDRFAVCRGLVSRGYARGQA